MDSEHYKLQGVEVKSRVLSTDCYADTIEVHYMGLNCAAKKFHFAKHCTCTTVLKNYASCCHEYCKLLGRLRHPNLVQFLGFYYEPESIIPVLVYESLHIRLSDCLDKYGLLPENITYSIFKDVSMALRYLHEHSPPIVHGSLSASKIMLSRDMFAKLIDVGITNIEVEPVKSRDCKDKRMYPKKMNRHTHDIEVKSEIYSFGLLMLHVTTGKDILSELSSVGFFTLDSSLSFDESELLQNYVGEVCDHHPLLDLVKRCLTIDPKLRPSTVTLLQKVCQVSTNHPPPFINSLEMLRKIKNDADNYSNMKAEIQRYSPQFSVDVPKTQTNEIERLRELVDKVSAQNLALQARMMGRKDSPSCVEDKEILIHSKKLQLRRQSNHSINCPLDIRRGHMKWIKCSDIPVGMFQAQSVYLRNRIYVGGGNTGDIMTDSLVFEYDLCKDTWRALPPAIGRYFGLGKLEGELIAVGGMRGTGIMSTVFVFDSFTKRWKDSLPPLNYARYSPNCSSVSSSLIISGGISDAGEVVSIIEVMKSDTFQWYTAGYLPRTATLCFASTVAIDDIIYILGGYSSSTASSSSRNTHYSFLDILMAYNGMTPNAWSTMAVTPHYQATVISLGSCLLSLGGTSSAYTLPVHQSMYAYSSSSKSWLYVGDLPYAFCHGTAVSISNNEFYVLGGWVKPGKFKRSRTMYRGCVTA